MTLRVEERSAHDCEWQARIESLPGDGHLADSVSPWQAVRTQALLDELLRHGRDIKDVLDVGCGYGHFMRAAAQVPESVSPRLCVHGCDISEAVIDYHARHSPWGNFTLSVLDEPLPYDANAFDCIVASEVIEHVYDVNGFLADISRCLRPGGVCLITTPYHGVLKMLAIILSGQFDHHFAPSGVHIRFFSRSSIEEHLAKSGLNPEGFRGLGRARWLWKSMLVRSRKLR